MKIIKIYIFTVLILNSINVNAAVVSIDWKNLDDNLITRDASSSLDWLDLTETNNMSRDSVLTQLEINGQFYGWRYASSVEVAVMWDNFGISLVEKSAQKGGGYDSRIIEAVSYLGNILCENDCIRNPYGAKGITSDLYNGKPEQMGAFIEVIDAATINTWFINDNDGYTVDATTSAVSIGSYLVREITPVPLPASLWLFISSIVGLIGFTRRR